MAITARNIRAALKDCKTGGEYKQWLRAQLGIKRKPDHLCRGDESAEDFDNYYVEENAKQMDSREFNLGELTDEFMGREFGYDFKTGMMPKTRCEQLQGGISKKTVWEDASPVGPEQFQDINAWSATISGLVEVRILEGYRAPEYVTENLVRVQPTRANGGKVIGISYPSPRGQVILPGIEFPNVGLQQMWVWARENLVYGMKLSLDRYAQLYDLSGELLAQAEALGRGLAYGLEYYRFAGIYGLAAATSGILDNSLTVNIGNNFLMNDTAAGTPNACYQTAGSTSNNQYYNYINKQSNVFSDWTSLNSVRNLLNLMRDPVNLMPFNTEIEDVLIDPYYADLAMRALVAESAFSATGNVAASYGPLTQGTGSTFPPVMTQGPAFPAGSRLGKFKIWYSNIAHQVLADGGFADTGAAPTTANKAWVAGDCKKAFIWRQAQDLLIQSANPNSSDMLSKNIINLWTGQWAGQFVTENPRRVILNTA